MTADAAANDNTSEPHAPGPTATRARPDTWKLEEPPYDIDWHRPEPRNAPPPGDGSDPAAGEGRAAQGLEFGKIPAEMAAAWGRPAEHGYRITPAYPRGGEAVRVEVRIRPGCPAPTGGRLRYWALEPASLPVEVSPLAPSGSVPLAPTGGAWDQDAWEMIPVCEAEIPGHPDGTVVRYEMELDTTEGPLRVEDAGPPLIVATPGTLALRPPMSTYSYQVGAATTPEWLRDAVIYQLVIDRFAAPPGRRLADQESLPPMWYAGGTVEGLRHRLDELQDLGVNCLYLSCLHAAYVNLGYDVYDYKAVNERLGALEDVRRVIEDAHGRGMRLILDFEASYLGRYHPAVMEAFDDPSSAYRDWLLRSPDDRRFLGFMGAEMLPSINHANVEARRHVIEGGKFWVELGFDGLRLDSGHAASLDFWTDFGAALRAVNPEVALIGEVLIDPELMRRYHGRMTSCFDFPLNAVLRRVFARRTSPVNELERHLAAHAGFWPESMALPVMLENHDEDRFLFAAGDDERRLRLAAACLLALPYPTLLYYGTEIGLSQHTAGSSIFTVQRPMPEPARYDTSLREHFRALIALRNANPAMRRGRYRTLHVDAAGTLSYALEAGGETVLVALNNSHEERAVPVPGAPQAPDRLSGMAPDGGKVLLGPFGAAIFAPHPPARGRA